MSAGKGPHDYLDLGNWNAVCAECGRKRKASELVKNWQGLYKCPEHNEPRHPQDFVRAVPDIQTPPWVQPPTDEFVGVCFPNDQTAIADYGVADCMICDFISPAFIPDPDPPFSGTGETVQFISALGFEVHSAATALVTMPVNVIDGDFLILCAQDTSTNVLSVPFGYTEFSNSPVFVSPTTYRLRVFYRIANGEPPDFLIHRAGSSSWHGFVACYRGTNVAAPFDTVQTSTGSPGTPWVVGLATTKTYTRLVNIVTVQGAGTTPVFGVATGHTSRGVFTISVPDPGSLPILMEDAAQHLSGYIEPYGGTVDPPWFWMVSTIALVSLDSV